MSGLGSFRKEGQGTLVLNGNYQQADTFEVAAGTLTLQSGTFVDGNLNVGTNARFENVGGTTLVRDLQNAGTVAGTLRATGSVSNAASGEIRLASGESFLATAQTGHLNQGLIDAVGASVEFDGALTNAGVTGLIYGRDAVLRFDGGLSNQGSLRLSNGTTDVYGAVSNEASGEIVVSGLSVANFVNDVVNNGRIQTGEGSTTVLFGDVTGAGSFSGAGSILIEGSLSPGNSPGSIGFEGDLTLGDQSTLNIELAGTTPGTQHDQITVGGTLQLSGILSISFLEGYEPAAGDSFQILSAGNVAGQFDVLALPQLEDNLSWESATLQSAGVLLVVPEPSTALLLGLGLTALAVRRGELRVL